MDWLFTEYDVPLNSQVLHWNFSIFRATSYSVNNQATVHWVNSLKTKTQQMTLCPQKKKKKNLW